MQICTTCHIEKELSEFHNRNTKNGVKKRTECIKCANEKAREYHRTHKEQLKVAAKIWHSNNKDKANAKVRAWIKENPDAVKKIHAKHRASPKRKAYIKKYEKENKEKRREQQKKRFRESPQLQWAAKLRKLVQSIMIYTKRDRYIMEFGCTMLQFRAHIQSTFQPDMTWENYGRTGDVWHVDHIKCLDSFDLTVEEERYKAAHFSNHQAMWALPNLQKGNR